MGWDGNILFIFVLDYKLVAISEIKGDLKVAIVDHVHTVSNCEMIDPVSIFKAANVELFLFLNIELPVIVIFQNEVSHMTSVYISIRKLDCAFAIWPILRPFSCVNE